ncbi:MAG: glycosyltransferase [Candidatus Omnitrophica bacterium]|nr:glycosyltransferase [Candidatus Omnitrophota bacterium]
MTPDPILSIITPVLNGKRFMEGCLQNVIDQNCPHVEHIVLDGESQDGTVNIIRTYAEKYPHIIWVSQKDPGIYEALNRGTEMARGRIIGVLNVDDYYEPGVLNRVLEIFRDLPTPSFVAANCKIVDEAGKFLALKKPSRLKLREILLGKEVCDHPENPSSYFYHKALHMKIGGYPPMPAIFDFDFLLKALSKAHCVYVDETWGNFRYMEGTITFREFTSGRGEKIYRGLLKKHRKSLSFRERPVFYSRYFWHHAVKKLWHRLRSWFAGK